MTRGILLVDMAPADCWEDAFPVGIPVRLAGGHNDG
jgi:hypothetical protein